MFIQISDDTLNIIKEMMKKEHKDWLRIDYAENSCSVLSFKALPDTKTEKDIEFQYKDINVVAATQVELIVSKIIIGHKETSKGLELTTAWE